MSEGPHRGSCLCGAVRFEADAFTPNIAHCHCSMCRKFHGAAFATLVGVERARFRWLSGEASLRHYTAGNGTTRSFCQHCGSSLLFSSPRAPGDVIEIALAAFDGDVPVQADTHIFVGSGAAWAPVPAHHTRYEAGRSSQPSMPRDAEPSASRAK